MTAVNEAEYEEIEALFARLDGQTTDAGLSEAMKLRVVRLVTGKPAAAYALAKVFLDQERALAAARDHIDRLERGTPIPAAGAAGDTAGGLAACGFAGPLRNGGFTTAVRAAVVGVVGSLALGSALMEMLRVDPAAAAGSSHFDPDDVDALGFDDDPELN